jgi:hypothetical protein
MMVLESNGGGVRRATVMVSQLRRSTPSNTRSAETGAVTKEQTKKAPLSART